MVKFSVHISPIFSYPVTNEYDRILQDQSSKGIIERVTKSQVMSAQPHPEFSLVHNLPHHGVVRQDHTTTKLHIVYDGSARLTRDDCFFNNCLQV